MASLQTTGVSISGAVGYEPPVSRALQAAYLLGQSLGDSRKNLKRKGVDAVYGGNLASTPIGVAAGYLSFVSGSNWLDTLLPDMTDFTAVIAFRSSASLIGYANAPAIFGNYGSAAPRGPLFSLVADQTPAPPGGRSRLLYSQTDTGGTTTSVNRDLNITDASKWSLIHVGRKQGVGRGVWNRENGTGGLTAATTQTIVLNNIDTLQFGNAPGSGLKGPVDIALAALHIDLLSDAEQLTSHQVWKTRLAQRGIIMGA